MFPQRMQGKKSKMRLQKRGMQQYKKCLKYIKTQHPNMSRDELHNVLNSIYEEKYSGSNKIVLYYRTLIRGPDSSQAKVLKVYYKLLMFWKEPDQGRMRAYMLWSARRNPTRHLEPRERLKELYKES